MFYSREGFALLNTTFTTTESIIKSGVPGIPGMAVGSIAVVLVSVFIIPCINAWHKEHKLKKALKKYPGIAETGISI